MRDAIVFGSLTLIVISLCVIMFPECANEDSMNCYWNAATNGNGIGQSFIDIAGITYYLP